ncbi:MAG: ATP-binding protein, partial [Acidobacteriota bacterium]
EDQCEPAGEVFQRLEASDLMRRARRAERELARTEKLAALGETAARLAHEVRNPLTAARSLAQLMAQEPLSPDNAEHGALVVRELDRVEKRVQAMLEFARRECLRVSPVDLDELVQTTLRELETFFTTYAVEVRYDPPPAPVTVAGDRERLRQVVVNLITNGVEAQRQSPRLTLTVERTADGASLHVRDRGPGVPEPLRGRLFEPFVSSKAKGTGLGLAISQRIAGAHGGRLETTAVGGADGGAGGEENRGAVFSLHLPPLDAADPPFDPAPGGDLAVAGA